MKNFRDLKVWERAHRLTLGLYRSTVRFPREEMYGLTSQSAVVVPQLAQTSQKDAEKGEMQNSSVICKSPPDPLANSTITYCWRTTSNS